MRIATPLLSRCVLWFFLALSLLESWKRKEETPALLFFPLTYRLRWIQYIFHVMRKPNLGKKKKPKALIMCFHKARKPVHLEKQSHVFLSEFWGAAATMLRGNTPQNHGLWSCWGWRWGGGWAHQQHLSGCGHSGIPFPKPCCVCCELGMEVPSYGEPQQWLQAVGIPCSSSVVGIGRGGKDKRGLFSNGMYLKSDWKPKAL